MIVLNQEQKKLLLKIYSTGICDYQQIDFIRKAQSEAFQFDQFDSLKYVAELEELCQSNPEKFYSPIESNPQVVLTQENKDELKAILKSGVIPDEALNWLPYVNPFEGLTYAHELEIFGKMMEDYR